MQRFIRVLFILGLIFLLKHQGLSQSILIKGIDTNTIDLSRWITSMQSCQFNDKICFQALSTQIVDTLQSFGYVTASLDSVEIQDSSVFIQIFQGIKYKRRYLIFPSKLDSKKTDTLRINNISEKALDSIILEKKLLLHATLTAGGHPFAWVNVEIIPDTNFYFDYIMSGDKERKVTLKDVHIAGDANITKEYLKRIIDFKEGSAFDESQLQITSTKLRELPFVDQFRAPSFVFVNNEAYLIAFINKKNVNRLDLVIGFQPNTNVAPGLPNKLVLTGTALIELANQFGQGERILAEYLRPSESRQQIRLEADYPYILNSPIGVSGSYNLFKSDTTFLEQVSKLGFNYQINIRSKFAILWNRKSSNFLSVNTAKIINTRTLPADLDYTTDFYGIEMNYERLDFRLNPRKGLSFSVRLTAGNRKIKKNNQILGLQDPDDPDFKFATLFDTIRQSTLQLKPELKINYFIPIRKRLALKAGVQLGMIESQAKIFYNEKFRIGGYGIMRGFNEQSLFVTGYMVNTAEFKIVLDDLSSIFLFLDYGLTYADTLKLSALDRNTGMGLGLNFGTKIGVFGISAAVGKQQDTSFDFQKFKIHFGYQSVF